MMEQPQQTVDLAFFAGKQFTLTAVDTSLSFPVQYSGDGNSIAFTLDGVTYAAVEDPGDGYRSSLDCVLIVDAKIGNEIPPHVVVGREQTRGAYGTSDCIELIDVQTGKTVIRFGTDNSDDYYPSFVGDFDPTALAANNPA